MEKCTFSLPPKLELELDSILHKDEAYGNYFINKNNEKDRQVELIIWNEKLRTKDIIKIIKLGFIFKRQFTHPINNSFCTEFYKSTKNYNTVMGSAIDIYQVKNRPKLMTMQTFQKQIPAKTVRDLLTQEEITHLQALTNDGNYPLVAICKEEDQTSFSGYYPLNAGIKQGLVPHRTIEGLDILKDFCSGG